MKKSYLLIIFCCFALVACGGGQTVKRTSKPTPPSKTSSTDGKSGGYYLDDGPHANPPANLDDIPNAIPKSEPPLKYSIKPYSALGQKYYPLKTANGYKKRGMASWYGKRYHGKKTASGEVYNMYGMSAAHTVLPLPSYLKVTSVENGRSVIVRVNDRGPFKHSRVIDLSYAAAYKLRLIDQGSGLVDVEAIDPSTYSSTENTVANTAPPPTVQTLSNTNVATPQYLIQAGAFSNESNAENLRKKIQSLNTEQKDNVNRVYNNGLHRLIIGPYSSKLAAEQAANNISRQLGISTIITNQ